MKLNVKLTFETNMDRQDAQRALANVLSLFGQERLYITDVSIEDEHKTANLKTDNCKENLC